MAKRRKRKDQYCAVYITCNVTVLKIYDRPGCRGGKLLRHTKDAHGGAVLLASMQPIAADELPIPERQSTG